MTRILVVGGLGLFGRTIVDQLRALGVDSIAASRRSGATICIDAEDSDLIRAACRPGDLVVDAAGPFHVRSTTLVEAAIEVGFDVIDINDNLGYAEQVLRLSDRIDAAGIRVLSSSSSVSAIAAAVISQGNIRDPVRIAAYLAPASRHTANAGAARSLLRSVGRPMQVLRDGRLQTSIGWSQSSSFEMPRPVGAIRGHLFESADAAYLPRIWPSLRDVAMFVDCNVPGVNHLLSLGAASPVVRAVLEAQISLGAWIARHVGSLAGGIGYEIEEGHGTIRRYALIAKHNSYLTAVAPAVLAALAIARDRFVGRGLVLPDRHAAPSTLFAFLSQAGIELAEVRGC